MLWLSLCMPSTLYAPKQPHSDLWHDAALYAIICKQHNPEPKGKVTKLTSCQRVPICSGVRCSIFSIFTIPSSLVGDGKVLPNAAETMGLLLMHLRVSIVDSCRRKPRTRPCDLSICTPWLPVRVAAISTCQFSSAVAGRHSMGLHSQLWTPQLGHYKQSTG